MRHVRVHFARGVACWRGPVARGVDAQRAQQPYQPHDFQRLILHSAFQPHIHLLRDCARVLSLLELCFDFLKLCLELGNIVLVTATSEALLAHQAKAPPKLIPSCPHI